MVVQQWLQMRKKDPKATAENKGCSYFAMEHKDLHQFIILKAGYYNISILMVCFAHRNLFHQHLQQTFYLIPCNVDALSALAAFRWLSSSLFASFLGREPALEGDVEGDKCVLEASRKSLLI